MGTPRESTAEEKREGGEAGGRSWLAMLIGLILIVSMFFFKPPQNANWIYWSATLGRLAVIVWLIARYAKEPD